MCDGILEFYNHYQVNLRLLNFVVSSASHTEILTHIYTPIECQCSLIKIMIRAEICVYKF